MFALNAATHLHKYALINDGVRCVCCTHLISWWAVSGIDFLMLTHSHGLIAVTTFRVLMAVFAHLIAHCHRCLFLELVPVRRKFKFRRTQRSVCIWPGKLMWNTHKRPDHFSWLPFTSLVHCAFLLLPILSDRVNKRNGKRKQRASPSIWLNIKSEKVIKICLDA